MRRLPIALTVVALALGFAPEVSRTAQAGPTATAATEVVYLALSGLT
jgi:hypothetical protein